MNSKGRPEKLTDDLKVFITKLKQGREKKLKGPEVLEEVKLYLKTDNPDILPGLSSIQKYLKRIEDNDKPSPLDNPWHLGTLKDYPLPAEVIPFILLIQEWSSKEHPEVPLFQKGLTIRQSLWISRLYEVAKAAGKVKGKYKVHDTPLWLWSWSKAYSQYEIICQLSGTPFDTAPLDKVLRQYGLTAYPISASNAIDIYFADGHVETITEKEGEK